jgi:diguanylate cyclase (GGDEF)-like protein
MIRRSFYKAAVLTITAEIVVSAFINVYFAGSDNYYQLFVLVAAIAHLSVLKFFNWERVLIILVLYVCYIVTFYADYYFDAPFAGNVTDMFRLFNAAFAFLAAILMLSMEKLINNMTSNVQTKKMDELKRQAHIDPLTQLYNRRYGGLYFDSLKKNSARGSICMAVIDIDDFKRINDTYLHTNGDKVLVFLSNLFKSSLRQSDYVFRWGGEEFLIIMVNTDLNAGFHVIDSIREKVAASEITLDGRKVRVTITAGIAELRGNQTEETIARCDQNLYIGKRGGKNVVIK